MPNFRCYLMRENRRIYRVEEIEVADCAEAPARARALLEGERERDPQLVCGMELWRQESREWVAGRQINESAKLLVSEPAKAAPDYHAVLPPRPGAPAMAAVL